MTAPKAKTLIGVIAGLAVLIAVPALAAEVVVIEARGIDLVPGQSIDGSKPLKLGPGAKLSLIAQDGRSVDLRGPFEGSPVPEGAASGTSVTQALLNMGTQTASVSSTLGVVRAGADDRLAPDARMMDITKPGHRCLISGAPAVLWWPNRIGESTPVNILPADRSWKARVMWPAASDTLTLPASLPLRDGQSYVIEIGGFQAAITLHTVPATLPSADVEAGWMVEKGCVGQAAAVAHASGNRGS